MMMNFDDLRKNALEEVVSEKIKTIYTRYYGYEPRYAKEKIDYEMAEVKKFYEEHIEES